MRRQLLCGAGGVTFAVGLAFAPAVANGMQRSTFTELCQEVRGGPVTENTVVQRAEEDLSDDCNIILAEGVTLRIFRSDISSSGIIVIRLGRDASLKLDRSSLDTYSPNSVDLGPGASVDMDRSSMSSYSSSGIRGSEGGLVRLHRSSIDGTFGAGISTAGDITLEHSSVLGAAREAVLFSGGTLTLNHSSGGGHYGTSLDYSRDVAT